MRLLVKPCLLAVLVIACDAIGPQPVCACDPPPVRVIRGTVVDASAAPAANAFAWYSVLNSPCSATSHSAGITGGSGVTPDGDFRHDVTGLGTCFRVFATDYTRNPSVSDTAIIDFDVLVNGVRPDSVQLTLHFH
jgi:hypothetical protein